MNWCTPKVKVASFNLSESNTGKKREDPGCPVVELEASKYAGVLGKDFVKYCELAEQICSKQDSLMWNDLFDESIYTDLSLYPRA